MADNKTFKDGGGTDYSHALQDISSVFYTKIVGAAADDAAAGGNPIMMGGKYIATPSALSADGDAGYVLLNQYRGVCVQLMDSSGNLINPVSKNEDDAHSSGDAGQPVWAVRRDTRAVGSGTDGDYSSLNVNASGELYTRTTIENISDGEYETVAASQTTQALGATGATGDWLQGVLIVPASTSPGAVAIKDGAGSAITVFAGGADSVGSLVPFFIPLGIKSAAGAWQITTGANVSCIAVGNFT